MLWHDCAPSGIRRLEEIRRVMLRGKGGLSLRSLAELLRKASARHLEVWVKELAVVKEREKCVWVVWCCGEVPLQKLQCLTRSFVCFG
jgi:hypothetical protein